MTPRNKLTYLMNLDSAWNVNMKNELGIEQESQINRKAGLSGMWGLIWESLLTDDLVFRSQVGYSKRPQYWYPWRCEDGKLGECDAIPGIINTFPRRVESQGTAVGCDGTGECSGGNVVPHRRDDLYVYQAFNRLQYFLDSKTLGEHSLVLKHQFYTEEEIRKRAQPGDYYDEYLGTVPAARTTFYSNDPRQEEARYGWWIGTDTVTRNVAAVSDAWRPTRHLTMTPALSWVWAYGSNSAGGQAIDSKAWAPSATVAWDATHDGRTVVRGSYSQYVDVAIRTPVVHTLGDQVSQRCLWNADNAGVRQGVRLQRRPRPQHHRPALRPHRRQRRRQPLPGEAEHPPHLSSTPWAASGRSPRASRSASTPSTASSTTSTSSGRPTGSGTPRAPGSSATATAATRPSSTWARPMAPAGTTGASPPA